MVKVFSLCFLPILLWGVNIEFSNLKVEIIPNISNIEKKYFNLSAKSYVQKISKKDKFLFFFNRKKFMLENNYYFKGFLTTNTTKLHYVKAYRFNSKIYFFDVNGVIDGFRVKAKEVIFDEINNYILKNCEARKGNSILRRKVLVLSEE